MEMVPLSEHTWLLQTGLGLTKIRAGVQEQVEGSPLSASNLLLF